MTRFNKQGHDFPSTSNQDNMCGIWTAPHTEAHCAKTDKSCSELSAELGTSETDFNIRFEVIFVLPLALCAACIDNKDVGYYTGLDFIRITPNRINGSAE